MSLAIALETSTNPVAIETLNKAQIIYLGEIHDHPADHEQEFEILTNLYRENQTLALGFEMFQRPFQPYLDQYIAGGITETELRKLSEYDSRWGFEWEYYAPLLRFAQAHHLPLIALNTPAEITNKVAVNGLDSLEQQDYRYIPARENLDFTNEIYLEQIKESFREHAENNYGKSQVLDNFVAAQILWDETMAEAIATYASQYPATQILVFVGQAHVAENFAIPDRVTRRSPSFLTQQVIKLSPQN